MDTEQVDTTKTEHEISSADSSSAPSTDGVGQEIIEGIANPLLSDNLSDVQSDAPLTSLEQSAEDNKMGVYITRVKDLGITNEDREYVAGLSDFKASDDVMKLGDYVQALQERLPRNDMGLPEQFIFPFDGGFHEKVLAATQYNDISDADIEASSRSIVTMDNQAVIDTLPVWDRLAGEGVAFHHVFKLYRDMRYFMTQDGRYLIRSRSIASLAQQVDVPVKKVRALSYLFNWTARCEYYDAYMNAEMQKRVFIEQSLLQADHLNVAQEAVKQGMDALKKQGEELSAKDAIRLVELGTELGRISLGLPGNKPVESSSGKSTLNIFNNAVHDESQHLSITENSGGSGKSTGHSIQDKTSDAVKSDGFIDQVLNTLHISGALETGAGDEEDMDREEEEEEVIIDSAEHIRTELEAEEYGDTN